MEDTPTGCANELLTILETSNNDPKSRSVNTSLQRLDLDPNCIVWCTYSPNTDLSVGF